MPKRDDTYHERVESREKRNLAICYFLFFIQENIELTTTTLTGTGEDTESYKNTEILN